MSTLTDTLKQPVVNALSVGVSDSTSNYSLALNARLVFDGDSVTAGSLGVNYTQFAVSSSGGRHELPQGYNQGVGGQTSADLLAGIATTLSLNPDVVCIFIGGNDLINDNQTFEQISSNLRAIYDAILQTGSQVIAIQYFNLGDGVLSANAESIRLKLNSWISGQADVHAVSLRNFDNSTMLRGDGIHPNYEGASFIGNAVSQVLMNLTSRTSIFKEYATSKNVLQSEGLNPELSGVGGILSGGATGEVADDWAVVTNSDANIACSKDGGTQVIELSGNNTTGGALIQFRVDIPNLTLAELYSAIAGIDVSKNSQGIAAVVLTFTGTSQNASVVDENFPASGLSDAIRADTRAADVATDRFQIVIRLISGPVSGRIRINSPYVELID